MMNAVTARLIGIPMSATAARLTDSHSIMPMMPSTVRSDVNDWLMVWLRLWATLSMSLVTRLRSSPRGCRSK